MLWILSYWKNGIHNGILIETIKPFFLLGSIVFPAGSSHLLEFSDLCAGGGLNNTE